MAKNKSFALDLHNALILTTTAALCLGASACATGEDGQDATESESQLQTETVSGSEGATDSEAMQAQVVAPAASGVKIRGVTLNGTGCPLGTATAVVSPSGDDFTVKFNQFAFGFDGSSSLNVENCTINIDAVAPAGKAFAVASVKASGEASLAAQTALDFVSQPRFAGTASANDPQQSSRLEGPLSGPVTIQHDFAPDKQFFSTCGTQRSTILGLRGVLRRGAASSTAASFKLTQLDSVKFAVRNCDGSPVVTPDAGVTPPVQPPAPTPTPASGIKLRNVTAAGGGCPSGTATAVISPNGEDVTVKFSKFSLGFDTTSSLRTDFCTINFDAITPPGKSYAIASYRAEGTLQLGAKTSVRVSGTPRFVGAGASLESQQLTTLKGPQSGPFSFEQTFGPEVQMFSECGRQRMAQLSIRPIVEREQGTGTTGEAASISLTQVDSVKFAVRSCTP